jgi:hypothetical protein
MTNNEIDFPHAINYDETEFLLVYLAKNGCKVSYELKTEKEIQDGAPVVTSADISGRIAHEFENVKLSRFFTFMGPEEGTMFDQLYFPTGGRETRPENEAPIWDITRKLVENYFAMPTE